MIWQLGSRFKSSMKHARQGAQRTQALEITELAVTRIETGEERLTAGASILLQRPLSSG